MDPSPGVGDLLKAVVKYSATSVNVPVLYLGVTTDDEQQAFILEQLKEDVALNWLEGRITKVGASPQKKRAPC